MEARFDAATDGAAGFVTATSASRDGWIRGRSSD
jgi:hypothetical protein